MEVIVSSMIDVLHLPQAFSLELFRGGALRV